MIGFAPRRVSILEKKYNRVVFYFVVFYAVGIAGLLYPPTFNLFVRLIPLALLLSSIAVFLFHAQYNKKTWTIFAVIYLFGYGIEVAGVNTKLIFGYYSYDVGLGLSLFNTPLIIGINWLLLVYISLSVTEKLKVNRWFQITTATLMLVAYDLILEQVAPLLKMWHWKGETVPVKNYIAWFFVGFLLTTVLKFSGIRLKNKIAPVIFICQILFFVILYLGFKIIH